MPVDTSCWSMKHTDPGAATRPYPAGWFCDEHAPWNRPWHDPPGAGAYPDMLQRMGSTPTFARSAPEINKDRGGYMSKQRAARIAKQWELRYAKQREAEGR